MAPIGRKIFLIATIFLALSGWENALATRTFTSSPILLANWFSTVDVTPGPGVPPYPHWIANQVGLERFIDITIQNLSKIQQTVTVTIDYVQGSFFTDCANVALTFREGSIRQHGAIGLNLPAVNRLTTGPIVIAPTALTGPSVVFLASNPVTSTSNIGSAFVSYSAQIYPTVDMSTACHTTFSVTITIVVDEDRGAVSATLSSTHGYRQAFSPSNAAGEVINGPLNIEFNGGRAF